MVARSAALEAILQLSVAILARRRPEHLVDGQAGGKGAERAEGQIPEGVGVGGLQFGRMPYEGHVFTELPSDRGSGADSQRRHHQLSAPGRPVCETDQHPSRRYRKG